MKKSVFLLALLVFVVPLAVSAAEVIFSGQIEGQFDLFRANLDHGKVVQLTNTSSEELMPCVSPDGKTVAFISDRQGANSIYLADLNEVSKAKYVSAGVGAYANPAFSPDGSKIIAQYAPDPEEPFLNTKLVVLDFKAQKQEVLIDSLKLSVPANSETIKVIDRPLWVSESLFVYVLAEFADAFSGRVTKSTLYMYDLKNNRHIRMGGGESYFTSNGRGMGFKATMPTIVEETEGTKSVFFTAVRGHVDREPMKLSLTGSGKGILPLNDGNFFGPMLYDGNTWVYGTMNENSLTGLSYRKGNLKAPASLLKFPGRIIYPALISR